MTTLALIGIGRWGANYIKTIDNLKNIRLKYICGATSKNLSKFSNKYIKLLDYRKLADNFDVDGVIIATPASTHFEISKYFLTKKIPILVEKPMVANYQEALKLKKIYEQSNSIFMVGHTYLYNPAFLKAVELVDDVTPVKYIEIVDYNFGPFREDISPLWDWAPHAVSMMLELMDSNPIKVSAWGVGFDLVYARFEFPKKKHVFLKIGSLSPIKQRQVSVVGEKSSIVFDDTVGRKVKAVQNEKVSYPSYLRKTPLESQVAEFVKSIVTKKNPKTDFKHALKTVFIIDAMERAIKQNKEVLINL